MQCIEIRSGQQPNAAQIKSETLSNLDNDGRNSRSHIQLAMRNKSLCHPRWLEDDNDVQAATLGEEDDGSRGSVHAMLDVLIGLLMVAPFFHKRCGGWPLEG